MESSKTLNRVLWTLQGLLALFFAGASGAPKLLLPADQLPMPIPLAPAFLLFIGTCEVLGALGLVLPGITHVKPNLTVAAALGLVLLTICAATYQVLAKQPESAIFALVMGAIAAFIAYGRWRLAPLRGATPVTLSAASPAR